MRMQLSATSSSSLKIRNEMKERRSELISLIIAKSTHNLMIDKIHFFDSKLYESILDMFIQENVFSENKLELLERINDNSRMCKKTFG